MEHHPPWLAPFVRVALSNLLVYHQGKPTPGWEFNSLGDRSKEEFRQTDPYDIYALVAETLPRLSQRTESAQITVSDGEHTIVTRFSRAAHKRLLQSEHSDTATAKPFALVKLSNPGLRLSNNFDPPRLELLVNSLEAVTWRELYNPPKSSPSPVCEDSRVASLIRTYSVHHKTSNQVDSQANSSPQSIKSQNHHSPDKPSRLGHEATTQVCYESQMFLTQAPFTPGCLPTGNSTKDESCRLQFIQQIQNATRIKAKCNSNDGAANANAKTMSRAGSTKDRRASSRAVAESAPLTPSEKSRTSRPASLLSPTQPSQDTGLQNTESIIGRPTVDSETTSSRDANRSWTVQNLGHPEHASAESLLKPKFNRRIDSPSDPPLHLNSPFQKWRQDLRQGRYLPRYLERISTPQRTFLESNNVWQPPRVGQRARPGDIPLPLLERLSEAADAQRETVSTSPSVGSELSQRDNTRLVSKDALRPRDQQHSGNVSDCEPSSSPIDWSSSPPVGPKDRHSGSISDSDSSLAGVELSPSPPPQQRRQFLPDDSSPNPRVAQIKQRVVLEASMDGANAIVKTNIAEPHVSASSAIPAANIVDSLSQHRTEFLPDKQKSIPTVHLALKPSQVPDDGILEQRHPSPVQQNQQPTLHRNLTSSSVSNLPENQNIRTIDVARTPYVAKSIASLQETSDPALNQSQTTRLDNAHPVSSDFVPGTFSEPASEENIGPKASSPPPTPRRMPRKSTDPNVCQKIDKAVHELNQQSGKEPISVVKVNVTADGDTWDIRTSQPSLNDHPQYYPPRDGVTRNDQVFETTTLSKPSTTNDASRIPTPKLVAVNDISASLVNLIEPAALPRSDPQLSSGLRARTKKRDCNDSDNQPPSKRCRVHPEEETEPQPDPDFTAIFEELRVHRREQYANFGHPSTKQSTSRSFSSSVGAHSDGARMRTPPLRQAKSRGTSNASERTSPNQTSTPLTIISDYGPDIAGGNNNKGCGVEESLLMPAATQLESVFTKFRGMYSDYNGQLNDFSKAVKVLKKMIKIGTAPHPFLIDDVIFHHHHSYRQYLVDQVLSGEDLMTYDQFYNTHIIDPCHLQKIITRKVLESLSDLDNNHDPVVQPPSPQQTVSPAVVAAFDDGPVTRGRPMERTHPPQIARNEPLPTPRKSAADSEPVQIPTREPSPELGTPNIDRSRSKRPKACEPVPPNPMRQVAPVSRRSLPSSFTTPSRSSTPTNTQTRDGGILKTIASRSLVQQPGHTKSSPSVSTKLAKHGTQGRYSALNRGSPKRIPEWPSTRVSKTHEWWKDGDTPFKRFQKQHSALPSERSHMAAWAGGEINISNWRA